MYDFSDYVSDKESFWDMVLDNSVYQCVYQWIVLLLLILILIFVILCFRAIKREGVSTTKTIGMNPVNDPEAQKIVFCKSCGKQCSASMKVCPHCGTKRG